MFAYIHFRTLKAKIAFLNHCKTFRLQKTLGQSCARSLCCAAQPPERQLFLGKFPVMIKDTRISRPEEINWRSMDMSGLSRVLRMVCSLVVVVLAILVCSVLIGFCTLYVASSSNCQNYVAPTGATVTLQIAEVQARGSQSATFCYCNANLAQLYTNAEITNYCS